MEGGDFPTFVRQIARRMECILEAADKWNTMGTFPATLHNYAWFHKVISSTPIWRTRIFIICPNLHSETSFIFILWGSKICTKSIIFWSMKSGSFVEIILWRRTTVGSLLLCTRSDYNFDNREKSSQESLRPYTRAAVSDCRKNRFEKMSTSGEQSAVDVQKCRSYFCNWLPFSYWL